jgi:MATE family multidrug resistance protein
MTLATAPIAANGFAFHVRETLRLAAPIAVARAAILVMFVADTVMTGWAGPAQLAALGLGTAVMVAIMLIAIGLLQAGLVLTSRALGRRAPHETGAILRASLAAALALSALIIVAAYYAEPLFVATGQTGDLAARAAAVAQVFAWGVPGMLLFMALNMFLEATGSPRAGMWVMIAANVVNIGFNAVLIFGWNGFPAMGAQGAILASSIVRWLAFFAALAILMKREARQGHPHRLFSGGGALEILPGFLLIGVPMGLAQGVESTAFAAIAIIAGRVSEGALAVHQALISLIAFVYMVSIGISGATAIRVGKAAGAGDRAAVAPAGWAGVALSACWTLVFLAAFLAMPQAFARIYGFDGALLGVAATTIMVAAFVLPLDGMMAVLMGALRGLADVWVPLMMQTSAFWLGAVPVAWVFAPALGAPGLMGAVLVGVMVSAALLALRFRAVSRHV